MPEQHKNQFLRALSSSNRNLLLPFLSPCVLDLGAELHEDGEPITHVTFPASGLMSLLVTMRDGHVAETAMVGSTGAIGLAVGMGQALASSRAVVQAPGTALQITAGRFRRAVQNNVPMMASIFAHQTLLLEQTQQTAACNALHPLDRRLASWLLQAHDHLFGAATIPFGHEFLSHMLGVRRATVSVVASKLQSCGIIRYVRGRIDILDRDALERASCECYKDIRRRSLVRSRAQRAI